MKLKVLLTSTLLCLTLPAALTRAADKHAEHGAGAKKTLSAADSELIAQARATYPLKTCLVSDEALGSMGEASPYIHRVAGKPDRVVFFCCDGCTDDFKANPEKFLAKVDAAKAKGSKAKKS